LDRFETSLESLANDPQRCPLAPENNLVEDTIRQLFVGKRNRRFRALFTIREDTVGWPPQQKNGWAKKWRSGGSSFCPNIFCPHILHGR